VHPLHSFYHQNIQNKIVSKPLSSQENKIGKIGGSILTNENPINEDNLI
jgi:hypothetical protein